MRGSNNASKTHCSRGHEFTPENTRIDSRGRRNCKQCNRDYAKKYRIAERDMKSPEMGFSEIGRRLGISGKRALRLYLSGMRKLARHKHELKQLQELVEYRRQLWEESRVC